MKKLVICLFVCSLGLALTVGCGGGDKKPAKTEVKKEEPKKEEPKH